MTSSSEDVKTFTGMFDRGQIYDKVTGDGMENESWDSMDSKTNFDSTQTDI